MVASTGAPIPMDVIAIIQGHRYGQRSASYYVPCHSVAFLQPTAAPPTSLSKRGRSIIVSTGCFPSDPHCWCWVVVALGHLGNHKTRAVDTVLILDFIGTLCIGAVIHTQEGTTQQLPPRWGGRGVLLFGLGCPSLPIQEHMSGASLFRQSL